jgi:hypothetical protein
VEADDGRGIGNFKRQEKMRVRQQPNPHFLFLNCTDDIMLRTIVFIFLEKNVIFKIFGTIFDLIAAVCKDYEPIKLVGK